MDIREIHFLEGGRGVWVGIYTYVYTKCPTQTAKHMYAKKCLRVHAFWFWVYAFRLSAW